MFLRSKMSADYGHIKCKDYFMKKLFLMFIFSGSLFLSCQTRISYTVRHPAEYVLANVKSITVLPFQESTRTPLLESFFTMLITGNNPNEGKSETINITGHIKKQIISAIEEKGYYELIPTSVIQENLKNSNPINCDAYITGHIKDFVCEIEKTGHEEKVEKKTRKYTTYKKIIKFTIVYEVFSSSDISLAYYEDTINVSSGEYETEIELPGILQISESSIDSSIWSFIHKIQPYDETIKRTLLNGNSRNKEFKKALKLAEKGELNAAKELFRQIYEKENDWEAAYNAAIIHQAHGEYKEARKLMKIAANRSRHYRVYAALKDIEKDMESN